MHFRAHFTSLRMSDRHMSQATSWVKMLSTGLCRSTTRPARLLTLHNARAMRSLSGTSAASFEASHPKDIDVKQLLATPTWSVASLLSSAETTDEATIVSPKQLHHLLRLSALPPPKDATEEAKMISTLSAQLHFVREIQKVDTTGVRPLQSLRDETQEGVQELEIGMKELEDAFAQEELRGKYHERIRRRQHTSTQSSQADWDVLGTAGKRSGKMFVVEGGKES